MLLAVAKGPELPLYPTDAGLLGIGDAVVLPLNPMDPAFEVGEKREAGGENG